MKLEDQVCSLELSKRLKELGVKQESLFVWEYYDDQCHGVKFIPYAVVPSEMNKFKLYSAFTVAELGEMLPYELYISNRPFWYATGKTDPNDKYYLEHEVSYGMEDDAYHIERDDKEADARAKMLIYLLENKLMEVPA